MPAPTTRPPSSRKATDSAEVDEPFLSSSRLSSSDCKVTLYLPFRGPATQPSYSDEAAGGLPRERRPHAPGHFTFSPRRRRRRRPQGCCPRPRPADRSSEERRVGKEGR